MKKTFESPKILPTPIHPANQEAHLSDEPLEQPVPRNEAGNPQIRMWSQEVATRLAHTQKQRQNSFQSIEDAGVGHFPREQFQNVIQHIVWEGSGEEEIGLIYKALRAANVTVAEKNRLLTEIFKSEGSVAPGDGDFTEAQASILDLLDVFIKNDSNFFLKNLAKSFLAEEYPEYSKEEKLDWIRGSWEHAYYFNENMQESIWNYGAFSERKINSPDELTDGEIEKIANIILCEERQSDSITNENNDLLNKRYSDSALCKLFLHDFLSDDEREGCFTRESTIISLIGQKTAGVYRGGILMFVFEISEEANGSIRRKTIPKFMDEHRSKGSNDVAELYKSMMSLRMRKFLEDYFGISFSDVSIHAQAHFLKFISEESEEKIERVKEFVRSGQPRESVKKRITSFLSLEQEGEPMGEKILDIGQQLPEVADVIFQKYTELIESTDTVEVVLGNLFDADYEKQYIEHIRASLVKRANDLLLKSHKVLQGIIFSYQERTAAGILNRAFDPDADDHAMEEYAEIEAEEIEKLKTGLARIKADVELIKNIVRTLRENNKLHSLSELNGVELTALPGTEIPESLQREMRELYDQNYPAKKGYSEAFRQKLLHGLDQSFRDPQATFHTVMKDGKLIAYLRLENKDKAADGREKTYFGAFNVNPEFQGARIGETFLEELLKQKSGSAVIEASADPAVSISSHYLERDGFIASGIEPLANRPLLKIELDTEKNKQLLSKRFAGFTRERIREFAERRESPREYLLFQKFASPSALKFPEGGWLMTHYFIEKDGSCYAVFERDPAVRNAHLEQVPKKAA